MKRIIAPIAAAVIASVITAAATDPLAFWQMQNKPMVTKSFESATNRMRHSDPAIRAVVYREADRFGVPHHIVNEHVRRESGWNVYAANPTSSARGLFQLIRGSHAEIVGRNLSYQEHRKMAFDPVHNARLGMAHIRACMDAMPGASAERLWKKCHVQGHASVGTSIKAARIHYQHVVEGRYAINRDRNAPIPVNLTLGTGIVPTSSWSVQSFAVISP
jgi:hypothetical protein